MSWSRQTDPRYYAKSQLKARGWTDNMITQYLGEPDRKRVNPRCCRGSSMCLFWCERVMRAEQTPEVRAWRAKILTRREAAAQVGKVQLQVVA